MAGRQRRRTNASVNVSDRAQGPVVQAGSIRGGVHVHQQADVMVPPVPQQLPPSNRHFVGRASELACLNRLTSPRPTDPSSRVAVIHGPGGVGKTTLAVNFLHSVKG